MQERTWFGSLDIQSGSLTAESCMAVTVGSSVVALGPLLAEQAVAVFSEAFAGVAHDEGLLVAQSEVGRAAPGSCCRPPPRSPATGTCAQTGGPRAATTSAGTPPCTARRGGRGWH